MKGVAVAVLAAALAVTALPAGAQEFRTLTLGEALEMASRFNPDYRQAQNNLELTGPAHRAAWGAFLPDLSLSLGTNLNFNRQLTAFDNFGNPIENPITEWRTTSSSSQGLSASLRLFDGGRRFHELSRVGSLADVRAAEAQVRFATVRAEVERQYFETLNQLDLLGVERGLLEGKRRDLESTERLFGLASVSRVDVLAAELEVQRQERRVQQVEGEYRKALLALRTAIGDPELRELRVTGPAPEPFDPAILDADGVISRARAGNPRVLQQQAQVEVSRAGERSARGGRWPTVSVSARFNQGVNEPNSEGLFDLFPDAARSAGTSLSISVPLFSRFQTESDIAQAEVDVRNANETLRRTELEVEQNIRSQLIDLESAFETLQTARRSADLAEERLRLAREAYRLTTKTFTDLQGAVEAAATERRTLIDALYGFHAARITLEETIGGPLPGGGS